MIKLLARPTYNAEQLVDKEKETILSASTTKISSGLHEIFWLPRYQPVNFCDLFKCH